MARGQRAGLGQQLDARRALAQALATGEPAALAAWLDTYPFSQDDLFWLGQQGIAQFACYRLEQAGLLTRLPAGLAALWQESYHQATAQAAAIDWEIERVLQALTQAGVDFIWMKGAALAFAVYPSPACRGRGDLDLWIQPEQAALAVTILQSMDYRVDAKDQRPQALALLVGGELQLTKRGAPLELIELQWPALRGEWLRRTAAVDHAGIWQRRASLAVADHSYPTMTPEDALIHLCVHQAISHQFSAPWLRNLLDIHLLVATQPMDWLLITARAADWRLATVTWTVLTLAQRRLGTAVPAAVLQTLAPSRWRRWLIDRMDLDTAVLAMKPGGRGHRRLLIQMALVDRLRDGARLLWRGLVPESAWLRARYGQAPGQSLWRLRLRHVWRLATSSHV